MDDIKKILKSVLGNTPNFETKMKDLEVYDAWPKAVGETVAKNCWPVKMLDGGELLVASHSNSWIQQMRFLEAQIISNLGKVLKDKRVRRLRYKVETKAHD